MCVCACVCDVMCVEACSELHHDGKRHGDILISLDMHVCVMTIYNDCGAAVEPSIKEAAL